MVTVSKVPGSAEVARGVPRLRGTVSGCRSHTKVFHRGHEHAKLLTVAKGRRRSKAVTEPAAVSETTVGGGMGSTTRENWANPLAVPYRLLTLDDLTIIITAVELRQPHL